MLEYTLRSIWKAANNVYRFTLGAESIGLLTIVVLLHIVLAIATLGLGDRTVCDLLRPLRSIFRPDTNSILDGVLEVTVAIPRAIVYYVSLYFRSYILAIRVLLLLWLSGILAMLSPLVLALVMGIVFGFSSNVDQHNELGKLVVLSFYPSLAYWYWRIDGRRLAHNVRNAWNC
jgi:hypothetical protein